MSIGRRFLNMARAELNSLLDFAARRDDGDGDSDGDGDGEGNRADRGLHGYSARELEEELERRRSARREVEDAIHGRRGAPSEGRAPPAAAPMASKEALRTQRAYAALEVAPGADFETVRKAYRTLMRKYHPDHHTESPEQQRAANEVAQRLTEAYKVLEEKLRK